MSRGVVNVPTLLWPEGLRRPPPERRLVYLDFNHWIYLAKAAVGITHGKAYEPALGRCRAARADDRAIFPLSAAHYMEMAGIRDPAQRRDVAGVMAELSDFQAMVNRTVVARLELDTVLTHYVSPPRTPLSDVELLGIGSGPAFGMVGGLRIVDARGNDITEQIRQEHGTEFDATMADITRRFERQVLEGPEDSEVPALRAQGWDPTVARRIAQQRANQETDLQAQLASSAEFSRGERLRDVILAREVWLELREFLDEALALRGRTLAEVIGDEQGKVPARALVRAMPSSEVAAVLKTEDHRNKDKRWQPNDIFDVDALALAVPYCDVVVTERHRCHVLRTARVTTQMNTVVLSSLSDLVEYLDRLH
ncbi:MAG: hypothetical protein LC808_37205 [Actinobacteria bacterium]|nr:hypothetical protein [Actinomycetota bacterium]